MASLVEEDPVRAIRGAAARARELLAIGRREARRCGVAAAVAEFLAVEVGEELAAVERAADALADEAVG